MLPLLCRCLAYCPSVQSKSSSSLRRLDLSASLLGLVFFAVVVVLVVAVLLVDFVVDVIVVVVAFIVKRVTAALSLAFTTAVTGMRSLSMQMRAPGSTFITTVARYQINLLISNQI